MACELEEEHPIRSEKFVLNADRVLDEVRSCWIQRVGIHVRR